MTGKMLGVILAGGESRRFGSPKAIAKRDGVPFYQYSIEAIKSFSSSVLIVTNPKVQHLFNKAGRSIEVVNDLNKYCGQGPLAGIYTAMETSAAEWYIVMPIDVPFIEQWVIEQLISYTDNDVEAIIPVVRGKQQPLISIYHYSIKERIEEQLNMGKRSVHQLLKSSKVNYIPIDEDMPFININRQTDYQLFVQDNQ